MARSLTSPTVSQPYWTGYPRFLARRPASEACQTRPVDLGSLWTSQKNWHFDWGATAAFCGFALALVRRKRLDQALVLVMLGCTAWALWILPDRRQAAVLLLVPLIAGVGAAMWIRSPQRRSTLSPSSLRAWSAVAERMDASLVWAMSAITVGGVWLAVPDTDVNVVIMMSVIPVAGLGWWDADRPPWTVRAGVTTLVVLGAISGAGGRTAWIGALACTGMIPFKRRNAPWRLVLAVHWLIVLAACRVVSRWELLPTLLGSLGLVLAGWATLIISERSSESEP